MRERNRPERPTEARPRPSGDEPAAGNSTERAQQLLRAGGEAIQRLLSTDSTRFLESNRQRGGQ